MRWAFNDAVVPVYILPQTIIVTLGFYVIKWNTGVALKYSFLAIATIVGSLAIYEVVCRTNATPFLFGMKLPKRRAPVQIPTPKEAQTSQ